MKRFKNLLSIRRLQCCELNLVFGISLDEKADDAATESADAVKKDYVMFGMLHCLVSNSSNVGLF